MSTGVATRETEGGLASSPSEDSARWVVKFYPVHVLGTTPGSTTRVSLEQGIQNVLNDWEQQGIELHQLVPTPVGDYVFIGRKAMSSMKPMDKLPSDPTPSVKKKK